MSEGGLLPPVLLEVRAKASEVYSELGKVRAEVKETAKETEGGSSRMSRGFQTAAGAGKALAIGAVGLAGVIGGFSLEAAMSAQVVDAKLRVAIKNAGGSMEELEPKIKGVDSRLRGFGYTNDETNTALAELTTAIKNPEKALDAMGVAADLARAKNIPLSQASMLVAKAMEGQTRPLKQLGIDLPQYAGGAQQAKLANQQLATAQITMNNLLARYPDAANKASKAHGAYVAAAHQLAIAQDKVNNVTHAGTTIMEAIEGRVKGAASAYGDTLKGKVAAAKAGLENIGEVIGGKLIPVVTIMIDKAAQFASWLGKHPALLYTLAGIIGGVVVAAILAYTVSMVQAAAVTIAAAAPVLAIVAAVAAVGVAIYELVTHWTAVWGAIKAAAAAVWDWMKGLWNWIKDAFIGQWELAIHGLESVWNTVWGGIKDALNAVWGFFKTVWSWIKTIFMDAFLGYIHLLGTVWGAVWGGIQTVINVAWGVIKQVGGWIMNNVINPIMSVVKTLGSVWSSVWGGIKQVAQDIAGAVAKALGAIVSTIQTIIGWVQKAITWFESLWSSADRSESKSQEAINMAARVPTPASINFSGSLIGSNLGSFATQRHDVGGWITGPKGSPQLSIDHGGEYMLSLDMLAGRQPIDPRVKAAITGGPSMSQQALTGGAPAAPADRGGDRVTVIAQSNASPHRIASEVGWVLRALA